MKLRANEAGTYVLGVKRQLLQQPQPGGEANPQQPQAGGGGQAAGMMTTAVSV